MADAKKKKAELEVCPEVPVAPAIIEQLERDQAAGPAMTGPPVEAATLSPRPGVELLCVRLKDRRKSGHGWIVAQRLEEKTLGKHRYVEGRRFLAQITVRHLNALEKAFGREYPILRDVDVDAVPVTVQSGIMVKPETKHTVLYVKYRGAWFGVRGWTRHGIRIPAWGEGVKARPLAPATTIV